MFTGTKIVAIGKNYAAHAVEMGGSPVRRAAPLFFLKPPSSVVQAGRQGGGRAAVVAPRGVGELHHEVELGVVIGARARHVRAADVLRAHVRGYVLALDMTARDLQAAAKAAGAPWSAAKGYDTFTPLSAEVAAARVPDPAALTLWLAVDGVERQRGRTADMLHSVPELVAYVSSVMTLEPGDVLLTGTPAGVGPVRAGQRMRAGLDGPDGRSIICEEFDVRDEEAEPASSTPTPAAV